MNSYSILINMLNGRKLQWTNSVYFVPTWYHTRLIFLSSCSRLECYKWHQHSQYCYRMRWRSARGRTKTEDLQTVRTRNLWQISVECNLLILTACNLLTVYSSSYISRVMNPGLLNMYVCWANLIVVVSRWYCVFLSNFVQEY